MLTTLCIHTVTPTISICMSSPTLSIVTMAHGLWALKRSCMGLLITAGFQLVVVALSGSIALLADTMHNFGDAITALLLWVAFVLAAERPASGSPMASAALKTSPAWSSSLLWL